MKLQQAKDLMWGTYGKTGTTPLKYKPLGQLSSAHLINILITQIHLTSNYKYACKKILLSRLKTKRHGSIIISTCI